MYICFGGHRKFKIRYLNLLWLLFEIDHLWVAYGTCFRDKEKLWPVHEIGFMQCQSKLPSCPISPDWASHKSTQTICKDVVLVRVESLSKCVQILPSLSSSALAEIKQYTYGSTALHNRPVPTSVFVPQHFVRVTLNWVSCQKKSTFLYPTHYSAD